MFLRLDHRSPPINLQDIGSVYFRLKTPGTASTIRLIRADVKVHGSSIFVSFNHAVEGWPFAIENDSGHQVTFSQTVSSLSCSTIVNIPHDLIQDVSHGDSDSSAKSYPSYTLSASSSLEYAWDNPSVRDKKILLTINNSRRIVDILEIGDLVPFRFQVCWDYFWLFST